VENRATLRDGGPSLGGTTLTAAMADSAPDQESVATWRSEQRRLLDQLMSLDVELGRMAELMLVQDIQETADLSRVLAIPAAEVANRRKRLKRAIQAYLAEGGS
jgi:hypothetical protein